jgi:hypothetical protein
MNKTAFILLLCLLPLWVVAGIYKWVDDSGQVHYSDQPEHGAKEIELPKATIYSPPPLPGPVDRERGGKTKVVLRYKRIEIVTPAADATIRSDPGQVGVSVELEPKLQKGHKVVVYLDGKQTGTPQASPLLMLENVDRGTHTLQAAITDSEGRELGRTGTVTFHLLRTTVPRIQNN